MTHWAAEIERDEQGKAARLVFCRQSGQPDDVASHPSDTPQNAPAGESGPLQRHPSERMCSRPGCGRALSGRQTEWCSQTCRWKVWDAKHPRLDFSSAAPAIGTPAHREQCAALDKRESKKDRLLALLRRGPAKTWECMVAGGSGWRSRKYELEQDGHRISVENHPDYAVYTLVEEP